MIYADYCNDIDDSWCHWILVVVSKPITPSLSNHRCVGAKLWLHFEFVAGHVGQSILCIAKCAQARRWGQNPGSEDLPNDCLDQLEFNGQQNEGTPNWRGQGV